MQPLETLKDGQEFIAITSGGVEIRAVKNGESFSIPSNGEELFSFAWRYYGHGIVGWAEETIWKVGDKVHFINDFGVIFSDTEIIKIGFWECSGTIRYFYEGSEAHWFPSPARNFSQLPVSELVASGKVFARKIN